MSHNKIVLSESAIFASEGQILTKLDTDKFFNIIDTKFRLNLNKIFSKKATLQDLHRFNLFLKRMKTDYYFSIKDTLILIEEKYYKFKRIVKLLDGENLYELKMELSKNNKRYRMPTNRLMEFIEDFE